MFSKRTLSSTSMFIQLSNCTLNDDDDNIDLQYSVPSLKAMMVFLCLPRHHKLCSIKGEMATALTELCGQCGSGLGSQHFGGNI